CAPFIELSERQLAGIQRFGRNDVKRIGVNDEEVDWVKRGSPVSRARLDLQRAVRYQCLRVVAVEAQMAVEGLLALELVEDAVLVGEALDLAGDVKEVFGEHGFGVGCRIRFALPSQVIGYGGFQKRQPHGRYLKGQRPAID